MKTLSIKGFENFLKQKFLNEMYIAKINKTYDKFLGKWSSLYNYMHDNSVNPGNVSLKFALVKSLMCHFGSQIIYMRKRYGLKLSLCLHADFQLSPVSRRKCTFMFYVCM